MMKIVIIGKNNMEKLNGWIDWLIHMAGYALVLISVSLIFNDTVYIDNQYFGFWGLAAAIIIYFLNKTVKPLIFWLTLPITGLTLGLFYPFINLFILKLVDFLLMEHFTINDIFMGIIVAIFISIMNIMMDKIIVDNIIKKGR